MTAVPMNMVNYEEARRGFALRVPDTFNYTRDVIEAWAVRDPNRTALVAVGPRGEPDCKWTFGDLASRSRRAANSLASLGLGKGDRILVMLPRIPAWYEVLLGAFYLGAIPMPATVQLTSSDIAERLRQSGASAVVVDLEGTEKIDAIRDQCPSLRETLVVGDAEPGGWRSWESGLMAATDRSPDAEPTGATDPLLIYFTSGTTGHPKMVLHTHASYGIGHDVTARYWQDLKPDDLHWTLSDTGWAKAAWGKLFGQWRIGAANFLWNSQGKPDYELMLHLIERNGVTTFCAPPTIYRQLVTMDLDSIDWSQLRHTMSAGEPLNPDTFHAWKEATGTEIHDGYGQTETCNLVANFRCMPKKPGSMGKPVPGYDVAIVDDEGNEVGPEVIGHIAVRTEPLRPVGLFREYWNDNEATSAAFRNGWYFTGDQGHVDEEGYFWFSTRADDVIISAGYRIGPFEVESVLMEHPLVAETAVVGTPDEARGQVVTAFVVLTPEAAGSDALAAELQDYVRAKTAPYKYPRRVEFVSDLPKTVSGKIRRVALRDAPG